VHGAAGGQRSGSSAKVDPSVSPIRTIAQEAGRLQSHSTGRTVALCSLVGVVAGLGVIAFQYAGSHLLLDRLAGLRTDGPAGRMLTTSFSIGSGGSAGVFAPSMVIGGALGGAVGLLAHQWMPGVVTQPGAYVAVGMAGFFSATTSRPSRTTWP